MRCPRCALGASLAASLTSLALPAWAQTAPRYALELTLHPAVDLALARSEQRADEYDVRALGGALWASVGLRTPYFLRPYVEGGIFHLRAATVRSSEERRSGEERRAEYHASMLARSLLLGVAVDPFPWLTLRAAIGFCDVDVQVTGGGRAIEPNNLDLGWSFDATGWLWRRERARLGVNARALLLPESAFAVVAVGAVLSADPLAW